MKRNTAYTFFYCSIVVGGLVLLLSACSRPTYDWGALSKGVEQVKYGNKQ